MKLFLVNNRYEYYNGNYKIVFPLNTEEKLYRPKLYADNIELEIKRNIIYTSGYKKTYRDTKFSILYRNLLLEVYNSKLFNIENYPELFSYNKRLNVYFVNFLYGISFEYLEPKEKFIRLYHQRSKTFNFYYKDINKDEKCYEYLINNKWAQRALCTWALRVGKFYTLLYNPKYKNIIKNLDYTWANNRIMVDSWVSPFHARYKDRSITFDLCRINKYGFKIKISELIKFINQKKCIIPFLSYGVASYYNNLSIPKYPKASSIEQWIYVHKNKETYFELAEETHEYIVKYLIKDLKISENRRYNNDYYKKSIDYMYNYYRLKNPNHKNYIKIQKLKLEFL